MNIINVNQTNFNTIKDGSINPNTHLNITTLGRLALSDGTLGNYTFGSWTASLIGSNSFDKAISAVKEAAEFQFLQIANSFGAWAVNENMDDNQLLNSVKTTFEGMEKFKENLKAVSHIYQSRNENVQAEKLAEVASFVEQKAASLEQTLKPIFIARVAGSENILLNNEIIIKKSEKPNLLLEDYQKNYAPNLSIDQIQGLIRSGKELFESIQNGTKAEMSNDPSTAESEVAHLTWFLMNAALNKGQAYYEGAFVVEDPEDKLYNFLNSSHSYERASSHLKGRIEESQKGIDCFNGLMPAHKRTLLFGRFSNEVNQKVVFIKPENFSANPACAYDLLMHGYEFAAAQNNKIFFPGSDDLLSMRKERVPVKLISNYKNIVPNAVNEESLIKQNGIAHMLKKITETITGNLRPQQQLLLAIGVETTKLMQFIKEHQSFFKLEKKEDREIVEQILQASNAFELFQAVDINVIQDKLTGDLIPRSLNNPQLNQIIEEFRGIRGLLSEDLASLSQNVEERDRLLNLVEFFASLSGLDHLEKRVGREVYLDVNELQDAAQ